MMNTPDRKNTKQIYVGNVKVGGNSDISVQTMTNTLTEDVESTVRLIKDAEKHGCDIIRVSCPTKESTVALSKIIDQVSIPVIADIHFNYKRALEAIESGAHCIRINPSNIEFLHIKEIVKSLIDNKASLRIGINSGSIEKDILDKYKEPSADAMVESALLNAKKLEDIGFTDFKISVKSSDVISSIMAYRKLSDACDYPLHIGVTESGTMFPGSIKSAIGIGSLLADGIGDTIRVSLSDDPILEIKVGKQILKSLGLLKNCVNIVSCPTCARTLIDVISISKELDKISEEYKKTMTISVLGCVVNGVGEAKAADIGIFGFKKGIAKIYFKGEEYITCNESDILINTIDLMKRICI